LIQYQFGEVEVALGSNASVKAYISYMREYSLLWHHIAQGIDLDVIPPRPPDRQTVDVAKECGFDYWCYDLRLILADLLIGAKDGGQLLIVPGGHGTCMLGHATAAMMKPMIESSFGKEVKWLIVNINPAVMFRTAFASLLKEAKLLCKLSNRSAMPHKLIKLIIEGLEKVKAYAKLHEFIVEHLHVMNDYDGAMSILRDTYDRLLKSRSRAEIASSYEEAISKAKGMVCGDKANISVSIIGDFYTTMLSSFPVFDLLRFLASQLGVRIVWVMDWWSFINPFGELWGNGNYRKAMQILGQRVTGSDIITVSAALRARRKGVDGLIHLSVFGCTPEATAVGAIDFFKEKYGLPPICSITFDEHTQPDAVKVRIEAFIDTLAFKKYKSVSVHGGQRQKAVEAQHRSNHRDMLLGIDVGSISAKVVILDADSKAVVYKAYERTHGNPIETLRKMLADAGRECKGKIVSVGVTGSGRELIGAFVGADLIRNEVTAHAVAVRHYIPHARTVFEIGGQDSKLILLQDGIPVSFSMNTVCAAGTGAFLDHQAARLGIPVEMFGEIARRAKKKVKVGGRCTVFAESDIILRQQAGQPIEELIAGLCYALVRNYFANVVSGRAIQPPYVLCGGVAANIAIKEAFEEMLTCEVYVPEHFNVMGAIGAALLAAEAIPQRTSFRGFELPSLEAITTTFECNGCSNRCLIRCFKTTYGKEMCIGSLCQRW